MESERGIVGDRHLVAVQTSDISRLTTHPVAVTPCKFVAVSGVGPKGDSNGSGKTSFLAAVSIVLADPQWQFESNGGKYASGVLFRPDAAGMDPSLRFTPAQYGYIAAVFADPRKPTADTALTVWVRVSSAAPYVQARWISGLLVADADSDEERALQADSLWQAVPPGNTISAKRMAQELYGDSPRCLSYLDTDLRPSVPSLLSQQMKKMKPEEIGSALVALSGMSSQLDEEERQRGIVLGQRSGLKQAEQDASAAQAEEDAELSAVAARDSARQLLAEAQSRWQLYAARQYLSSLQQDRDAAAMLSERADLYGAAKADTAEAAADLDRIRNAGDLEEREHQTRKEYEAADEILRTLAGDRTGLDFRKSSVTSERNQLIPQASRWNGQAVIQTEHELGEAASARSRSATAAESAADGVKDAEEALDRARAGRSGKAGVLVARLLAEPGIQAAALADVIDIEEDARDEWEPRLYGLRDAVAVSREFVADALAGLADEPGAQVIAAESLDLAAPRLTSHGASYPVGLQRLITALAERLAFRRDPSRADDDAIGLSTVGGFANPLVGRGALTRRAEAKLESALAANDKARAEATTAEARWKLADAQNNAARAAERLSEIAALTLDLDSEIAGLDAKISVATELGKQAFEQYTAAQVLRSTHDSQLALAENRLQDARRKEGDAERKLNELRTRREKLAVEAWSREFGRSEADAAELVEASPDEAGLRPQTLLRRASESVSLAMTNYLTGLPDIPDDLAEAEERRGAFAEQQPDSPVPLDAVARPLAIRLDGHTERDRVTQARIEAQRAKREQALQELRIEVGGGNQRLETLQDMIEHIIEAAMVRVSKALNRMSTYGATLEIKSVRPEGAAPWLWEVTPRWKRSPSGGMVSYREAANSAQVKVFAIQLVLAALIADEETTGRVLILDELGNSLGDVNRREVLASLSEVAEEQQVTILGTCQDSVLSDAADHFGELIWFTHATATDAYNQPTRVWGHDALGERVKLTADWLQAGRADA
jgi:hypothetical protein